MRTKTIYFILFCCIIPLTGFSQTDSIAKRFKKEFNSFNQSIQQKHQGFRTKNDSIFLLFLKDSWASFDVLYKGKPTELKPSVKPEIEHQLIKIAVPTEEILITDSSKSERISKSPEIEKQLEKKELPAPIESTGRATLNIDFYGKESSLAFPSDIPEVGSVSSETITTYFIRTGNSPAIVRLIAELQDLKVKLRLNDWGYFKLVESCAGKIESDFSSKNLLTWVILIKSGYNAKTGFSNGKVYLLLPFQEELFNNYYIHINGQDYFIPIKNIKAEEISQLTVHKSDYPGNSLFSLMIVQLPDLGNKTLRREFSFRGTKLIVNQSEQLINFYKDYPMSEMKIYFSSPLSKMVLEYLEFYFASKFKGLSEKEKVAVLLEFTQKTFSYQSDKDQFAQEKYFFPDELFFYPYSDCEDRAVLFAKLIKHFTHFDCIALDYPGHVNTAVNFGEETRGSFITVKGNKYVVCDPTYVNAPIGYLPEEFKGIKPKVITFD